jgi:hypothetical protein
MCRCWSVAGWFRGSCLHRPENWLVRQLNDEPKLVYKVGFIERKERLQLEHCSGARKPVTPCSGEGWGFLRMFNSGLGYQLGGFFATGHVFACGLSWMSWSVCPLLKQRKQPWEHFVYQPHGRFVRPVPLPGRFVRPCVSSSGYRNADL